MCELNRAEYAVRVSDVYMYRYLTAYLWALPAELYPPHTREGKELPRE